MEIAQEETNAKGRYTATLDGHTGEMTYSRSSPRLVIVDHTFVPDALRGRGVGQALALYAVEEARKGGWKISRGVGQALALYAVEEARKGGWKIIPLCPFMRAQTTRHAEWRDVIEG
ncbi:GNAT family N-acetyltransferase [Sinorhizobium medicae]|nr:GNAT family N-acetyltransferase [Sinorhizobium medicae]